MTKDGRMMDRRFDLVCKGIGREEILGRQFALGSATCRCVAVR